jgi:HK97 family phage major capsid protein
MAVYARSGLGGMSSGAFPADIVVPLINKGLSGAPFFDALTRRETDRAQLDVLSVNPTGLGWVPEGEPIPEVDLGIGKAVVVPAKAAGLFDLSSESVDDAAFDLGAELGSALRTSLGPIVDDGVLYGDGTEGAPVGVYGSLTPVDDTSLRYAAIKAAGEILAAGGTPDVLFLTADAWANEMSRETVESMPVYTAENFTIAGLRPVVVPKLHDGHAIVADSTGCYGVVRSDYAVEFDTSVGFRTDSVAVKVKVRVAAIIPAPNRSARSLTITPL